MLNILRQIKDNLELIDFTEDKLVISSMIKGSVEKLDTLIKKLEEEKQEIV